MLSTNSFPGLLTLPDRIGSYRIVRSIALGGMGQVLLAHDEGLDRPVAIKRLRPEASLDPERRERFRREARLAAGIDHPAIVRIYDVVEADGLEHIIMEYVEGSTLRAILKGGPMPLRFALVTTLTVADALASAHEHGVIHRDLKSENVMLTADAAVKITDFGVAKQWLVEDQALTQTSALLGTCRAMAPEQALGGEIGPRCDLFSLGVLLYEALTGISPFEDKNDLLTLTRLTQHPHESLDRHLSRAPIALVELVDELLAKSPPDRPESAAAVVRRLWDLARTHCGPLDTFPLALRPG